jgi:hypothetical protein
MIGWVPRHEGMPILLSGAMSQTAPAQLTI